MTKLVHCFDFFRFLLQDGEREKKVKKDGEDGNKGDKEGNDKDRVKKAEKNDEKEEEADSDSDTISINSDFLNADEMEVEICWLQGEREFLYIGLSIITLVADTHDF